MTRDGAAALLRFALLLDHLDTWGTRRSTTQFASRRAILAAGVWMGWEGRHLARDHCIPAGLMAPDHVPESRAGKKGRRDKY